jgi:hypothetical protein
VAQSHTPCNRCVRFATSVASGHATLATKRTLLLTWAGLSPADRTSFAAGAPILDTKVGTLSQAMYDMAKKQDLMIVSMKNDWERIFAFE